MTEDATIVPATRSHYGLIKDMAVAYMTELRYALQLPLGQDIAYFDNYFADSDRYIFLIKHGIKNAGFALINKVCAHPDSEYHVAEFYIQEQFRRHGVASRAASSIFNSMPGNWEISIMPNHNSALDFWLYTVKQHTNSAYECVHAQGDSKTLIHFTSP